MGKNFAQMEMRVILSHLFHHFTFQLSPELENVDPVRDSKFTHNLKTVGAVAMCYEFN